MLVYIARHGEATLDINRGERVLSDEGQDQVLRNAQELINRGVAPFKIRHSGITRARETAQIIAAKLKIEDLKETDNLRPSSSPTFWANRLEDEEEDIMLVGHMPFVSYLLEMLTGGEEYFNFHPAQIVCLEKENGIFKMLYTISTFE